MLGSLASVLALVALIAGILPHAPASAASVSAASFSGDGKTLAVEGVLYAKNQAKLTLNVTTATAAKCVVVSGDHSDTQTHAGRTSWSFSFSAGDGNGVKSVTVTAYDNAGTPCTNGTGSHTPMNASYVLDNAGPVVTASLSPAANEAGWNNSAVNITWDGSDAGVGFLKDCDGGHKTLNPCTDSVPTFTSGVPKESTGTDRLGNSAKGAVLVKVDTMAPTITGSRSPAQPASGWNNTDVAVSFTCDDPKQGSGINAFASGIKSCGPNKTVTTDGANQSVTGKAVDVADNQATATVGNINIDKTAPVVTGAATSAPNGDGWYKGDVSIVWTCNEALSGLAGACPANSTINGEGDNQGATSGSVSDKAGNSGFGSVTGIKIDRTAPNTTAVAPTTDWNNSDVSVQLTGSDALSGVKATHYELNGDGPQTGTSVPINTEGTHTLKYWSVDKAGNVEAAKTVTVKIDKTKPSINHVQNPLANGNGWNNANVTVTFTCIDGGSGIASCTSPQTVTSEGKNQPVTGTAVDNAGNSATDPATVSIDKTPPTISVSADRDANEHDWYKADVTVSFTCEDELSGIVEDGCTSAQKLGEGTNQSASGTATDAAGNSAGTSKTGINVDKTAPKLEGAAQGTTTNGWYRDDVTVAWTCSDAGGSGIDGTCPSDGLVIGEGSDGSANASVYDKAGNSTSATVSGIKIDRTAPTTDASLPAPKYGAWHAGSVRVTLAATDNLSQVDKTFYSVNGGSAQEYSGPFDVNETASVAFWSVDKAGNIEDKLADGHTITVQIDNTDPSIEASRLPVANVFGWNNAPVTVSFTCDDLESGLASCTPTSTLSDEGTGNDGNGQSVTGAAIDNVGNSKSITVDGIKIDTTKPTLSGSPTTAANAAGWYKGDVSIEWMANDGLSGIDPDTAPGNSTVTGEGADLGAGPVSVFDRAGNEQTASIGGIKIDRTPPVIDGDPTTEPNSAGWYKDPVTVAFTCTDSLSDVATCPTKKVLSDDGANLSVTSDPATDYAGNEAPGKTVGGIYLDATAPKSDADITCDSTNGWCRGTTATVELTAADQAGLSGVKGIHYKVNNGDWAFASGANAVVDVPLSGSGTANVHFYAEDKAGNAETGNSVSLKYDTIGPTVTHTLSPTANALDWNNSDVTVSFHANDDSDGSGVKVDTVTRPVTVTEETAGFVVNGEAYDTAGNRGTDSVTVKLDKTPPAIIGAATTDPTSDSWYNRSVTVRFTCSDGLSGIASCPKDVILTDNGADQSVTGEAVDKAGNKASFTVSGLNIDNAPPKLTIHGVAGDAIYTLGEAPTASCSAEDNGGSGLVANCHGSLTGGSTNGVGRWTYTATATDNAGNTHTKSVSWRVIYNYKGVSQPINDPFASSGATTSSSTPSTFKAGSTVPVKLRVKRADGTVVQTNTLPVWVSPQQGSLTTAQVDEAVFTEPATNSFRWDSTDQQYIYNWGTTKAQAGKTWTIAFKLDDGQTYSVVVALR